MSDLIDRQAAIERIDEAFILTGMIIVAMQKGEQMSDLIDRRAAIDALMEILDRPNHAEFLYTDEICKALNNLPSAQPKTSGMICGSCKDSDGTALYTTAKVRCKKSGELRFVTDYCNLPSAQPEIIRCKDCKYWNPHYAECEGIGNWFGFEGAWSEDGYCYKAERREG